MNGVHRAVYKRDHGYCRTCHNPVSLKNAIFHHFPVYRRNGGKSIPSNLILRCKDCERSDPHE